MSHLIRTLKQVALRKRDEQGEQGKRVSEKGFVEWKAADRIEELENTILSMQTLSITNGILRERIEELEADLKDYATAIGQNEQLRKENERLTAALNRDREGLK